MVEKRFQLEKLKSEFKHLDEILTNCIYMGAATGELQWEERYLSHKPFMEHVLRKVKNLFFKEYSEPATQNIQKAQESLNQLESKIFNLIRQQRLDEAKKIVFGEEYKKQKDYTYLPEMVRFTEHQENKYILMEKLRGNIVYLDEILTMSTLIAVSTGNLEWEKRYLQYELKLDIAIKDSLQLIPEISTEKAICQIDSANIHLIKMEKKAFELIKQNRRDEAMRVLLSKEYKEQKRIYSDGLEQVTTYLQFLALQIINSTERKSFFSIFQTFVSVFIIFIIGIIIIKMMYSWQKILQKKNQELLHAKKVAEEFSNAKSTFIPRMSHELHTPLNSVIGFSNILLKNKIQNFNDKDIQYLNSIQRNGIHLLNIINNILDISKIESGQIELNIQSVLLPTLLREIVLDLESQILEKNLTIEIDCPSSIFPIQSDPILLKQVLLNLIGNAIKFTEKGKILVQVEVDLMNPFPKRINIIDNGIGIPSEKLEIIFEAFHQVDNNMNRKYQGLGLGLTISKALTKLMGYEIEVQSKLGEGSTFTILFSSYTLPCSPASGGHSGT